MTKKMTPALALFLLLLSSQLGACAAPNYVLKDSGFPASLRHNLYWLDNDRVIFTGYEVIPEKTDKHGKPLREQGVYIWDTRENQISLYAKNASIGCYYKGYIRVTVDGVAKKGPMGQERTYLDMVYSKETWEGEPPEWEEGVKMHPINCRAYKSQGMEFFSLLPEHGYLKFGLSVPSSGKEPNRIVWYPKEGIEGKALPILNGEVWGSLIRYVEFLDSYVMSGGVTSGYWLLKPDGEVSRVTLPEIRGGWRYFMPTRTGVFAVGGVINVRRTGDAGNRGAYWIEKDMVTQIVSGLSTVTCRQ